jgi:redox-sensing transcriptional repressor
VRESIPTATVTRLPLYLRCLDEVRADQTTCSSEQLAVIAGVNPAQVRKDLSYVDAAGVRGVGYDIDELRSLLRRELGLVKEYRVAIAGAGNLGSALSRYPGFAEWGFQVAALFDIDPGKVGATVEGMVVDRLADLERVVAARHIAIGIIATPSGAAQEVANRFISAGVKSILNFAPIVLRHPPGVEVRRVDLSTELQILAYHLQRSPS